MKESYVHVMRSSKLIKIVRMQIVYSLLMLNEMKKNVVIYD